MRSVTAPAVAVAREAVNFSCPVGSALISTTPFFSTAGFWVTVATAVARAPTSCPGTPATCAT